MRPLTAAACALLLATTGAIADTADDVKAAYAAWDEAFNAGDAEGVAATYADGALFLPGSHEVIRGPEDIEAFFSGLFGAGVTDHRLELIEAMDRGDTVVAAARWSAKAKNPEGQENDIGGLATHVFEKSGDDLTLILHTFN